MKTAVSMNDVKRGTVDHISARTEWQTIAKQLEKKKKGGYQEACLC